jgi:hypothetical protein
MPNSVTTVRFPNTHFTGQHCHWKQSTAALVLACRKAMNTKIAVVGILAASIAPAGATALVDSTVGGINGNGKTLIENTGNTVTSTTFASDIAAAFSGNTGGVWNFDTGNFGVASGETVTLTYGTSQLNSLVLSLTEGAGGGGINQGSDAGNATSGSTFMGLGGVGTATRTFTLSTPLLELGLISINRFDGGRTGSLSVTFLDTTTLDTTTASTSAAPGNDWYFHGFKTTSDNPIVSFSLVQTGGAMRYDDLGFIVAPEPSTAVFLMGGVGMLTLIRRRKTVNRG